MTSIDAEDRFASRTLTVVFKVAAPRLGPLTPAVAAAAKSGDWELLDGGRARVGEQRSRAGRVRDAGPARRRGHHPGSRRRARAGGPRHRASPTTCCSRAWPATWSGPCSSAGGSGTSTSPTASGSRSPGDDAGARRPRRPPGVDRGAGAGRRDARVATNRRASGWHPVSLADQAQAAVRITRPWRPSAGRAPPRPVQPGVGARRASHRPVRARAGSSPVAIGLDRGPGSPAPAAPADSAAPAAGGVGRRRGPAGSRRGGPRGIGGPRRIGCPATQAGSSAPSAAATGAAAVRFAAGDRHARRRFNRPNTIRITPATAAQPIET